MHRTSLLLILLLPIAACKNSDNGSGKDSISVSVQTHHDTMTTDEKSVTTPPPSTPAQPPSTTDTMMKQVNSDKKEVTDEQVTTDADGNRKITRHVKFEPGRTTAVLKGKIKKNESIVYVLGAGKGQTMTAHLIGSTKNNDVVFTIDGPKGPLMEEGDLENDWSAKLPETGDYKIEIGMIESESSDYTLEVGIR